MNDWIRAPQERDGQYRAANEKMIGRVIEGLDVDGGGSTGGGARVVFNTASEHVPDILEGGYKNTYDLGSRPRRVGDEPPQSRRERVDDAVVAAVERKTGQHRQLTPGDLYFGAVEVNGSGMRYYGDICLVLREVDPDQVVLYRNSYDLVREPLRSIAEDDPGLMADEAVLLAGSWADVPEMVIAKLDDTLGMPLRRLLTTAAVSAGVMDDEDYLEAPVTHSFSKADIAEARTTAADAAIEGMIAERSDRGPAPSVTELIWRASRRTAVRALLDAEIPVVVAHHGRQRA
ncbi:hypothetical protein [Microbacterium sp. NPDC058389]|uniref:hypothetical protein n=1 Tax=Microbacterium sp. NPDC058389 TaxID=3346475 RepID=UPI0036484888